MEGQFNEDLFALRVSRAYIWRGLYMEGLVFGILRYVFHFAVLNTLAVQHHRILFLFEKIFTCISTVTRDSLLALHLANSLFNYFILWPQYKNTIILKRWLTKMKKDFSCQQLVCGHVNKFLDAAQVFRGQHQIPSAVAPFSPHEIYTRQSYFLLLYHTQMIFQAGNVDESASLFNLKEKKLI